MQNGQQRVNASDVESMARGPCPVGDLEQLAATCTAISGAVSEERDDGAPRDSEIAMLFRELEQALTGRQEFQHAVLAASVCLPQEGRPWHYLPLIEMPVLRAGIVTLFRFAPIPLHDHPGAYGVQRVLSGRVRFGCYEHAPAAMENERVVSVGRAAKHELCAGGSSCYYPDRGNLHELLSLSARSVLLSMTIRPCREQDRSWYFPVNGFLPAEHGLFNRLKKPTRVGERRAAERRA